MANVRQLLVCSCNVSMYKLLLHVLHWLHVFVGRFYEQNDIKHTPILWVCLFPIWYGLVHRWLVHWKPTSFKHTVLHEWKTDSLKARGVWNVAARGRLPKHILSNRWLCVILDMWFITFLWHTSASVWCATYPRTRELPSFPVCMILKGLHESTLSLDGHPEKS